LEVLLSKGRKHSSNDLYLVEVGTVYEAGKSLLSYSEFSTCFGFAFVQWLGGMDI
jgi:hypothetical protein